MMETELQFVTLDVFTTERYMGNQLAIVQVPRSVHLTQNQKQAIAQEFNLSETVILHDPNETQDELERDISIFLTDAEVPFAGHPTIGTACFIGAAQDPNKAKQVHGKLNSKAGPIPFTYSHVSQSAELAIPHDSLVHSKRFSPEDLLSHGFAPAVAADAASQLPFVSIVKGMTFCLVQLNTLEALAQVSAGVRAPQVNGLLDPAWHPEGAFAGYMFYVNQGEEITADDGTKKSLLRTRMIAGVIEDAATGSASAALAVYLALHDEQRDKVSAGPRVFRMEQGVEMGRRSIVGVEVSGDQATSRVAGVALMGSAVQVMKGSLIVPS